jgi:hypothetical protein
MMQFVGLMSGLGVLAVGMATAGEPEKQLNANPGASETYREAATPISCRLSPRGYSNRMEEVEALFSRNDEIQELEDGYAFRFPGDGDETGELLALIKAERQCCEFFWFELSFQPNQGPIWFHVRGSEEVKTFLETLMGIGPDGSGKQ